MSDLPVFFEGTGMPDPGWWEGLWPDPAKVLADVGMRSGQDVVDLCCGDGWFTLPIAKLARSVVAIDIDAKLVNAAHVRLEEHGQASNCKFTAANAYDIARFVRDPVDHVFLANAFHGVPDKPRLARAVFGLLKPGGLFAVVNWYARPREETRVFGEPRGPATELRIGPEETIKRVEEGGLRFRYRVDVSRYHYGAVFERPS